MTQYAVGDLQGCLTPLKKLLEKVNFNSDNDELWVAGDIVNRGPQSLETLRFIRHMGSAAKVVLGNHDLHLLASAAGFKRPNKKDTLDEILNAPDRDDLLQWLQKQPLLHHDKKTEDTMVHAGIPPNWSLTEARGYAKEVEDVLRGDHANDFFAEMYGNQSDHWNDALTGMDRLRAITNYFTRMRFCKADGTLDLKTKTGPEEPPEGYAPWFAHAEHACQHSPIIFGHWAALQGKTNSTNFLALDTGCVWGGSLTLMRLSDRQRFTQSCSDCC